MPRRALDRLHAAYGVLDDFERVITEVESPPPHSSLRGIEEEDRLALVGTLRNALYEYFGHIRHKPAKLYRDLAVNCVAGQDIILSFNYDLALERELKGAGKWDAQDGYGFDIENSEIQKSPVKVLKLHGSTNWVGSLAQNRHPLLWARPVLDPLDSEFLGYSTPVIDRAFHAGGTARVAVIMPGRNKQFYVGDDRDWEPFYDFLWDMARTALRTADEIVIIGYSCPIADLRARAMILGESNRNAKITVCCHADTPRIEKEFIDSGFERTQAGGLF